jgi:hypothetical protein
MDLVVVLPARIREPCSFIDGEHTPSQCPTINVTETAYGSINVHGRLSTTPASMPVR